MDSDNNRIRKIDASTGIITTVAGTGANSDGGDGDLATGAAIAGPRAVVVDRAGNLYIASSNGLVRRIDAITGVITTYAGSTQGYSGDGGPATAAKLNQPANLAMDSAGNLYIADTQNRVVRKVDGVTKIITTVAGGAQSGYAGDGGPATSAKFGQIYNLAVDNANNLYINDVDNDRVRKVDASTGIVITIAGTGTAGFAGDGGPATGAQFSNINGMALDGAGNLYFSDSGNNRIREVTTTGVALTFASTAVGSTSSDSPQTVTVSNIGNAALTLPPPATGLNPSISTGFSLGGSSSCPQVSSIASAGTLAAGASCTELVSFAPQVAGTIGGSLVLTDNALNAPAPAYANQTIALSGTATTPPLVATTAVTSTLLTVGQVASFTPITATGGTHPLTYSVSPGLPAGMVFNPATGEVSGTATGTSPVATYTVTVTDASSTTASATFSLVVDLAVSASTIVPSTSLTQGLGAAFTPVTASGGTGTLTYTIAPTLPAGLTLSPTGAVSGVATAASGTTVYTVTAADTNGEVSSATFSLSVNPPVVTVTAVAQTILAQSRTGAPFTPVTSSGGTGTLTYTIAPALPAGLSFSPTGVVTGTPSSPSPAASFVVTVTDSNGASSSATFGLTVDAAIAAVVAVPQGVLVQNRAASAFTPVTASGGTAPLTFTVAPSLPAGLTFSSTGVLSGTSTVASTATTYTVTVTDADGISATAGFSLTVSSPIATATALTSSNLNPAFGAPVTLSATVAPAPVDSPPGTVTFYAGTTLLGTSALNGAGIATLTLSLPLGPDAITAVFSGSAHYDGSSSRSLAVSAKAGTAVTCTASPTTQLAGNPLVLTATAVSSTAGVLTGTVTFFDGTSVLATVPIGPGGVTTYSSTALSAGSHNITASYSGDADFVGGASSPTATSITIADLNLHLSGDDSHTVLPGAAVAYNFPVSPVVTSTFLYDVHLTATGLPPGATYTFSPAMIPAGSGSLPVTLNVQTAKTVAGLHAAPDPAGRPSSRGLAAVAFAFFLPLLGARPIRKRLRALPKPLAVMLFALASLSATAILSGCGSGGFFGATATSGHYTITVTATSGSLVRTSAVQLTIQ